MTMITYINIDERYGDAVEVTIDDYRELNPEGEFSQNWRGIYEDGELIAEAQDDTCPACNGEGTVDNPRTGYQTGMPCPDCQLDAMERRAESRLDERRGN
jgi:hypothetical protein